VNTSEANLPSYVRPEAKAVRDDLDLMADLLAGTRRVQEQANTRKYLRKWKDEQQDVYEIRRSCESVFEGLTRTLSAATGMLFAKAPGIEWNASETVMAEHWQDLDGQGTAGPVLAKRFSEQAIRDGLALILVDHPSAPDGVTVTGANEGPLGLRPKWALYQRRQILSWFTETINNVSTVTQLVLEESVNTRSGMYGVLPTIQYRVLRLVGQSDGPRFAAWEVYQETKGAIDGAFHRTSFGVFRNRHGVPAPVLPIGIAYTGRTDAPLTASIPLLGVAWANLSHWRLSTALTFGREVAAYAQGIIIGELAPGPLGANGLATPGRMKLGPLAMLHLKGDNASFEWKAPPVEAFAPLERGIDEKLKQMGQMGMSFLITDTRAAETAMAKRLDATAENSTLATAAQGIQDAWNLAFEHHAWYLGIEKVGAPVLAINTDFENIAMDPQTMTAYVDAVARAGLPEMMLLEAWQHGGRIPPDTDLTLLMAEMMGNRAAIDAQNALDMGANQPPGASSTAAGTQKPRKLSIVRGADGRAVGIEESA